MDKKKSIWLTYAWDDNKEGDVDFIAQELIKAGLDVKLDRWNLTVGKRLWEQIESFIKDESKCDGWAIFATQSSLGNEKCKEEFYYALDRALEARNKEFPILALFPGRVDNTLLPSGIKTKLYVSLEDLEWVERIKSSLENREPNIYKDLLEPYKLKIHNLSDGYIIEVYPRAGTWSPFIALVLPEDKDKIHVLSHGKSNRLPRNGDSGILFGYMEGTTKGQDNREYYYISANNEATPTQSYFILFKQIPSFLIFGERGGIKHTVKIDAKKT